MEQDLSNFADSGCSTALSQPDFRGFWGLLQVVGKEMIWAIW